MPRRREESPETLLIDRSAAAEIPPDGAISEWARDKRVFISSVMDELREERIAAAAAVRTVGAQPVMFEQFGGRDADPEDAYLSEVESSDIYIGILGKRYGKPLPSRFSATHAEYLRAEKGGLRIAIWAMEVIDREGHQQAFLEETRVFHVVPPSRSSADLADQILQRLRRIAAEDLAPWCKLGSVVFRAIEVQDHGTEISVLARIRDEAVAHALEAFRGDGRGRGEQVRLTWAGRSRDIRVNEMQLTTTTARSKTVRMMLQVGEASRDPLLEMSVGGRTPDDLTEAALRTALFGEKNPLADQHMGFFAELPDPLAPLREARVGDEIVRPLAELMLVDGLVGTGRAARITEFSLGASVRGERELRLSWQPPSRYSRERTKSREIAGKIRI